ncbi:MAG: ABC transporter permease [Massiliimalia sp.]|jgi:hypothetical protein
MRKNGNRKTIAGFVLCLICFLGLLAGQMFLIDRSREELFSGKEWVFGQNSITPFQLEQLDSSGEYGYLGRYEAQLTDLGQAVTVGLCNETYGEICGITFRYGRWFAHGALETVISQSLSQQIFGEENPCGRTLMVDGQELMICGVYCQRQGFFPRLAGDGTELIFTSRTGVPQWEGKQYAVYHSGDGSFYQRELDEFLLFTGISQKPEAHFCFEDTQKLIIQNCKLMLLLLEIAGIYICVKGLFWMAGPIRKCVREEASISIPQALGMLCILLLLAVCLLFWVFFDFQLFIPVQSLPFDNLFDITYYGNIIQQQFQLVHQLNFDSYYWNLSVWYLGMSYLLMGFSIFPFVGFFLFSGEKRRKNFETRIC